jgi:hypothetical protein
MAVAPSAPVNALPALAGAILGYRLSPLTLGANAASES